MSEKRPEPTATKVIKVRLWLRVENNNKHIRGKKKAREEIERCVLDRYHPIAVDPGGGKLFREMLGDAVGQRRAAGLLGQAREAVIS